jgi:glutathione S-transferase
MHLIIGGKWSSTWTMRGWLACKLSGLEFTTETLFLSRPDSKARLAEISPTGRIPVLIPDVAPYRGMRITDTLAIAETLWELAPDSDIWPADPRARAAARMVAAEMHGHFAEIRAALPMNLIKRWPIANGVPSNTKLLDRPGVRDNIARVETIWRETRAEWAGYLEGAGHLDGAGHLNGGGPYLFGGRFTFADAMYAPMASRLRTYSVEIADDSSAYVDACLSHPLVTEWIQGAEDQAREIGWDAVAAWP